jgi:hypothetical protein
MQPHMTSSISKGGKGEKLRGVCWLAGRLAHSPEGPVSRVHEPLRRTHPHAPVQGSNVAVA